MSDFKFQINDKVEIINFFVNDIKQGYIVELVANKFAVIDLQEQFSVYILLTKEVISSRYWFIPLTHLRLIEDTASRVVTDLEKIVEENENQITILKSLLEVSEELRKMQEQVIDQLQNQLSNKN